MIKQIIRRTEIKKTMETFLNCLKWHVADAIVFPLSSLFM